MKKFLFPIYYILIPIIFVLIGWFANTAYHLPRSSNNPIAEVRPTPFAKYTIENLSKTTVKPVDIKIGNLIKKYDKFSSYKFYFEFDPTLTQMPKDDSALKKISGVINIPDGTGPFPVIVMFRGYVDPTQYFMGEGTQPAASIFAANGYITIASDFLGYGESDKEATDVFESRFQTYTTAMTLLKTIAAFKDSPLKVGSNYINVDNKNIFIWGHSNGGQIALTTLEITGTTYPTVLWAPVSMSFPGSILYYTIEADDSGKYLADQLAKFDENYDPTKYSLTNYLNQIKAPIQLNQGTADAEVPYWITDDFDKKMREATVSATYIKYPSNDHNMRPNWNLPVQNALDFFKKHIQ